MRHEYDEPREYRVGERVPAGVYREVESRRLVHLSHSDTLPPSFDGRIAHYVRVRNWGQSERSDTNDTRHRQAT